MAVFDMQAVWNNGHFKPLNPPPLDQGGYYMLFLSLQKILPVTYSGGVFTPPNGALNLPDGNTYNICIGNSSEELENFPTYG
jgi:predicted DNA-binding antitoxin AbrB/MazE fold protein